MHMLLILLALCLRKPNGISHLFSIAYAFAGNGWIVPNFVRVHFTTRQVPAVALGILDHGFALHELFLIQKVA